MKKKILILFVLSFTFLIGIWMIPYTRNITTSAIFSAINIASYPFKQTYKESIKYSGGGVGFECSKPIKLKKTLRKVGHMLGSNYEILYLPVNSKEANSICHMTWIE